MASLRHANRLLLLLTLSTFLLTTCSAQLQPTQSCPSNEDYRCGPTCIETCDYKPTICNRACRFGCFCKEGFVRQSNETGSPCIEPAACVKDTPRKCCKNQEYRTCGTACPQTCDDFSFPLPKPARMCPAVCKSGCFCKEGYYRTGRNRCVAPDRCCTGENEEFRTCGTACPETCSSSSKICTKQCVRGCFCKSADYVRKDNSTNSPCIKRNQCSV